MTTLPPVSPQVLSSNPQFRALYVQLTGEKENAESTGRPALLKPNGATAALVDESEAVDKDVKMYLSRAMRVKVLLKALAKVAGGGHDEAELDPHVRL
ncbi:hypothetical protein KEM55_007083 [Ascosphaera atra]|nr:hypothetical protein KEM55_007083 [Ascosphaera atra]